LGSEVHLHPDFSLVGAVLQGQKGILDGCSADGGSLPSSPPTAALSGRREQQWQPVIRGNQDGGTNDYAVLNGPYTGGTNAHYNINIPNSASGAGVNGNLVNGGNNINMFSNPAAVYNEFRPCILGFDTSCGAAGQIRGMSTWNMDMNVAKDINLFRERVSGTLSFQFSNVFNHEALANPTKCRSAIRRLRCARFERVRFI